MIYPKKARYRECVRAYVLLQRHDQARRARAAAAAGIAPADPWPACLYRESCGCTGGLPVCYHPSNGPRFGHESTLAAAAGPVTVRRVTRDACLECQGQIRT